MKAMAENKQTYEPVFPRETVESFSGNLLLINKVMKISMTMAESLREWEAKWSEERRMWREERSSLLARIAVLEEKSREGNNESQEGAVGPTEATMKKEGRPREGVDMPISDARWEEEQEIRKRTACRIVIAPMVAGIEKRKVIDVLKQVLGRRVEEEKVEERACGDGIKRWHARLESAGEAKKALAEEAAIRREHKIKFSPETTFLQRQTRQTVERRAEEERMARRHAKVKTDGAWICVDEKWEIWLESEARWASEEEWNQRRRREEITRAERRLERLRREEESATEGEGRKAAGLERSET